MRCSKKHWLPNKLYKLYGHRQTKISQYSPNWVLSRMRTESSLKSAMCTVSSTVVNAQETSDGASDADIGGETERERELTQVGEQWPETGRAREKPRHISQQLQFTLSRPRLSAWGSGGKESFSSIFGET